MNMSENLPKVAQILFYLLVIEFILAVVYIDGKSLMPKSLAMPVSTLHPRVVYWYRRCLSIEG
jgi:hypothetical protein